MSPLPAPALAVKPFREHFDDPRIEARRLFGEAFGTFLLVTVAAGAAVVSARNGGVSQTAAVVAPGLLVMAVILFMGAVSGAHLNPAVSIGFALRGDFPWRRVPGYVLAQFVGAVAACAMLRALLGDYGMLGATDPGRHVSDAQAFGIEAVLTMGLVSTILGTASRAQNVGPLSAVGVGGYIALAGLWASPISGASMNPARSFGPDLVTAGFDHYLPYLGGPLVGAVAAVVFAFLLRGPGGDPGGVLAAQGSLRRVAGGSTLATGPRPD